MIVILPSFANNLLKHTNQSQKTLTTVAWEASALLIIKVSQTPGNKSGEYLRSRGFELIPLCTYPVDVHPLVLGLWNRVAEMTSSQRRKRPSDAPITSTIEAACAAAAYWPAFGVHLANTLLSIGLPEDMEPALMSHCFKMFSNLLHDFTNNNLPFQMEDQMKVDIFFGMVKSGLFEKIQSG